MAFLCPGKNTWPELVGTEGHKAVDIVEKENKMVKAFLVPVEAGVTQDFRCDRVRITVDAKGIVVRPPMAG